MTISLLPVISEDGQELHWENQEASVSYVKDLDQVRTRTGNALVLVCVELYSGANNQRHAFRYDIDTRHNWGIR